MEAPQYSEDVFLVADGDVLPEENYRNVPGAFKTNKVERRELAEILSPILEQCRLNGDNFIETYHALRNAEILAKCGDEEQTTVRDDILMRRRRHAIREKYNHKQFINPDKLPEFFYRILKERFYTRIQIDLLSLQLGVELDYGLYRNWYELNQ